MDGFHRSDCFGLNNEDFPKTLNDASLLDLVMDLSTLINKYSKRHNQMLDQICHKIPLKYYRIRTEKNYFQWSKRFILFHNKHHPTKRGAAEVEPYFRHLTGGEGYVAISIQNQALAALMIFYREVLDIRLSLRIDESSELRACCWSMEYMPDVQQGWRQ